MNLELSPRSLRTRLTLWNICVLALILLVLALVLRLVVTRSLMNSIDTDLKVRAKHASDKASFLAQMAAKSGKVFGQPLSKSLATLPGTDDTVAPSQWHTRFVEKWFEPTGKRLFGPPDEKSLDPVALARAARGEEGFTTVRIEGEAVRVFSAPLARVDRAEQYHVVQEGYSLIDVERAQANLDRALLILVPVGLFAAGAGGLYLTRRMLKPVQEATREAARIGAADLSRRLPVEGDDEFAELTTTLNGMLARLESSFERQKQFTADASHELRTPLTVIKSASSRVLSRHDLPDDQRRVMVRIDRAASVMGDTIDDLLLLARSDSHQFDLQIRPVVLHGFLDDVIADFPLEGNPTISNRTPDGDDALVVMGDPRHLSRLFANLIENAARYTTTEGAITLDAQRVGETVIISVTDTGEGISPEHLPHLTERFYRADTARTRAGGGTGLGLSICRTIAEAHGGTLQIESKVGSGTVVSVALMAML